MNPAHLDLFRAVLRHGGMTRAADALGIGQPHVSRAIAQLERDLGFALFVRGHGSALPTPEAEAFAREVERVQAGLDHLRSAARQIRQMGSGPIRVACQPSLAARLLPRAIRRLSEEHPGVTVTVHQPDPDTAWSWVSDGRCDLALVRPRTGHAGVLDEPFLTVEAVCAVPRTHRLARHAVIEAPDLSGESLVAGAPGLFQRAVEEALAQAGVEPRFPFAAQYTAARCGLVAEGLGLAVVDPVPAGDLTALPIVLRPFRPRVPIATLLLRPAGRSLGRPAARLVHWLGIEREGLARSLPA